MNKILSLTRSSLALHYCARYQVFVCKYVQCTCMHVCEVSPRVRRDDIPRSPATAVRRWYKSRRIYVRPRTGPQSAHLWCPAVRYDGQRAYSPGSCAMGQTDGSKSFTYKMVPKTSWHRFGTKLRHCHLMY